MFEDLCWKEHDHAKSFVLRSYTMHSRFPVVSSSHRGKQLLCFMHGQGQKANKTYNKELWTCLQYSGEIWKRRFHSEKASNFWNIFRLHYARGIKMLQALVVLDLSFRRTQGTYVIMECSEGCSGRILNDIRVLPWKWPPQSPTPPPNSRVAGCPHWILRIWKCFPEKVQNQG